MELTSQIELENELRTMGVDQLRRERLNISTDLRKLQEQIGDLAFNNYRTYADAGRTTQHCTEIFTEMNAKLKQISCDAPHLSSEIKGFFAESKRLREKYEMAKNAADKGNPLWELIELPSRMDVCIRAGYYEAAYALTNYGMQLQQTSLVNNKLVKQIADKLVEARSFLLEELFNKFAGPLDLAQSIQVVNNVRKIPYLSNTQLRVSVLQYRDMYLDKQILDIATHPEFVLRSIEVFRDCMYDTMVLYLAVFPENELQRRDPTVDPRWEQWPTSAPSAVLSEWATRNVQRLLDLVHRADMKAQVDMSTVWSKLMSFASSFGRMGLDFRPTVALSLTKMVEGRFQTILRQITHRMVNDVKRIDVMSGDVGSLPTYADQNAPPHPPAELSMWDDLCVYGNGVLEALNALRFSLSPVLLPTVLNSLRDSLRAVFSWLGGQSSHIHFVRAARILAIHLVAFLNQCILFYFPHSTIGRLFGSSMTKGDYEAYCDLNVRLLIAEADGADKLEECLLPLLNPSKLDDANIDELLKKVKEETGKTQESYPSTFVSQIIEPHSIIDDEESSIARETHSPPRLENVDEHTPFNEGMNEAASHQESTVHAEMVSPNTTASKLLPSADNMALDMESVDNYPDVRSSASIPSRKEIIPSDDLYSDHNSIPMDISTSSTSVVLPEEQLIQTVLLTDGNHTAKTESATIVDENKLTCADEEDNDMLVEQNCVGNDQKELKMIDDFAKPESSFLLTDEATSGVYVSGKSVIEEFVSPTNAYKEVFESPPIPENDDQTTQQNSEELGWNECDTPITDSADSDWKWGDNVEDDMTGSLVEVDMSSEQVSKKKKGGKDD